MFGEKRCSTVSLQGIMMKVGSKVGVSSIVLVVVVLIAVFPYKRQNRPVPPAPKVAQSTPTITPPGYALLQPDALVLSHSLSQLPRDILTIPLLKDILTEDFVFYYEQNERRLSLQGTIRRIAYEHQLSFDDEILAYVFKTRASIALWKTRDGRLGRHMLFIERDPLLKIPEAVAKIVLDDKQLTIKGELRFAADVALPVYDLHYARNQHVYCVDHAGQLIVLSDAAMLLPEEKEKQAAVREFVSSPHPADRLLQHLQLELLASKHTIAVSARYLSFGYQRFFPSLEAIRFDYAPSGWSTLVLTTGTVPDVSALWEIVPTAPALCAALPLDHAKGRRHVTRHCARDAAPGRTSGGAAHRRGMLVSSIATVYPPGTRQDHRGPGTLDALPQNAVHTNDWWFGGGHGGRNSYSPCSRTL